MRTMIFLSAVLLLACGCKNKDAVKQAEQDSKVLDVWKEEIKVLSEITDKSSMEAQRPKLMELADKYKELAQGELDKYAKGITRPKETEAQKEESRKVMADFTKEYNRVKGLPGGAELLTEFDIRRATQQKQ